MNHKKGIIIVLVIIGIIGVVAASYTLFKYFLPDRKDADTATNKEMETVTDDPASTLYVSDDEGESWRGVLGARFSVSRIFASSAASRLFFGTNNNGIWYADSASLYTVGQLEDSNGRISSAAPVFDIAVSGTSENVYSVLQSGGRGYVVKIADNGKFQELFFAPLENAPVRAIALDMFASGTLYAGAGKQLYISENGGDTWRIFHQFPQEIAQVLVHPHIAGWYLVSMRNGSVYRSSDYGETWEDISARFSKFKGFRKNQRFYAEKLTNALYLTSNHGLLKSLDYGTSWQDISLIVPPESLPILGFAAHPTKPNVLFVSASSQLYKSEDGGRTWKGKLFSDKGSISVIAIDPARPHVVLIGFTLQKQFSGIFNL